MEEQEGEIVFMGKAGVLEEEVGLWGGEMERSSGRMVDLHWTMYPRRAALARQPSTAAGGQRHRCGEAVQRKSRIGGSEVGRFAGCQRATIQGGEEVIHKWKGDLGHHGSRVEEVGVAPCALLDLERRRLGRVAALRRPDGSRDDGDASQEDAAGRIRRQGARHRRAAPELELEVVDLGWQIGRWEGGCSGQRIG